MKKIVLFWGFVGMLSGVFGQFGLHTQFQRQEIASQAWQPANLLHHEFTTFSAGADASFWLNNNQFTLDGLFQEGNFLTDDAKMQILSQLGSSNRFQQGYHISYGYLNLQLGKMRWSASARDRYGFYARFDNPETFGLIFRGNAPYAGQTVTDNHVAFRQSRYLEFALGTGFDWGKVKLGIRGKLLWGRYVSAIDQLNYSLYTEEDGSLLNLKSDHDIYFTNEGANPAGIGGALDLGLTYEVNEKWMLQFALLDMGAISWDTYNYNHQVDITYEGFEVTGLIQNGGSFRNFFIVDTLHQLIFPDTAQKRYLMAAPFHGSIGADWHPDAHNRLMGSFHLAPSGQAPGTWLPLLNVAYHRKLGNALTLGANAYAGGMDVYGLGFMAETRIRISQKFHFNLYGNVDNIIGGIWPQGGQGIVGNVGVTLGM